MLTSLAWISRDISAEKLLAVSAARGQSGYNITLRRDPLDGVIEFKMIGLLLKLIPGFSTTVALTQLAVGVVYPTFKSFEAIESRHTAKDDTQWLTYWVVYSFLNLLEKFLWVVLMWIPLYSLLKTALLAWLVAPQFCGAKVLYTLFIRNAISTVANQLKDIPAFEDIVTPFLESQAAALQKKNDDVGKTAPPNDEQSVMGAGAQ